MKKQQGKKTQDKTAQVPGGWLYFTPEDSTVREIYEVVKDAYEVEIWEDAGVLEIGMKDGGSVDVEAVRIHPKDELTRAFAEENGCACVFLVTFMPEEYENVKGVMEMIMRARGGFFCGDTEDFTPVLR